MRTFLLICLLGVLPFPAFAADFRAEAAKLNEAGIRHTKAAEYEDAIKAFLKARSLLPLDATLKKNLATTRSKYGATLLKAGKGDAAVRQFRFAVALLPSDAVHQANLGIALSREGEVAAALKVLKTALTLNPKCAPALAETGTLHYREGELTLAVAHWEKAVALLPKRKDLAKALKRAKREREIESSHTTQESAHFLLSWDGEKDATTGSRLIRILEDAWEKIDVDLGLRPEKRTRVILYGTEDFKAVTGAKDWVAGLFDGKIRIPVKNFARAEREIRGTIFHEYTHVAVRSVTRKCPAWLNEGLAQCFEGRDPRRAQSLVLVAKKNEELFSLADLRASFTRFADANKARLAYAQSLSVTLFLMQEHGPEPIGRFLSALGEKLTPDAASERAFHRSLRQLELAWRETL